MKRPCPNPAFLILMQASKSIHECIKDSITNYSLSMTEFSVLEALYHNDMQTIHEIGKRILITSGSMTYVIDKLVEKGYAKRIACPNDRRAIHIGLTDKGNKLLEEIMPKHQQRVNTFFEELNSDELDDLINLLEKVKKRTEV
ncbi:MarR family winged helix-turn-helix transcriptional regulator [Cytobacillus oceanisediminis]|uniref:MarR family winged helix-turn-helix transcriptional regulator n=1 Tax=Cytobacillus oceanisediminis TaxID=665099 RepID=UPI001C22BFB4|nr:MarR family transcriptional regulator [Cytobacillus oceanisediminis]MBU8769829.1 MarR family transcriptional regulator [Cytobacillus oceanisediminis]